MNAHVGQLRKENAVSVETATAPARKLTAVRNKRVAKLREKPRMELEVHKLPFVGREHHQKQFCQISFWDVPLTGGYGGGCATGKAAALMYLTYLRGAGEYGGAPTLPTIIFDMLGRETDSADQKNSLKGQVVGFISALSPWLLEAARELGGDLDQLDQHHLLMLANQGLQGYDERHVAEAIATSSSRRTK